MRTQTLALILCFFVVITKSMAAGNLPKTTTPEWIKALPPLPAEAVEEIKRKENFELAKGGVQISRAVDRELGYGITPDEVEDAIRHKILRPGTKFPKLLTKTDADDWMLKITIPTYRAMVRKIVTIRPLNLKTEAALVFFAQNMGESNLKMLVAQKGRLNDGNYRAVIDTMPLYYAKYAESHRGLISRCKFQVGLLIEGLPTYTLAHRE